ncbi:MAG TPA: polyhydroxyalkanoic acid system family protein [Polyangiaceae bacterium]|nr:polyhydroxyalkanoic acid system family protein [Polyangiaceae bacterium]
MATIDVVRSHSLPKEEARTRAETFAKAMQQKLDLEWHWQGDRILFEAPRGAAKGSKGSVEVTDKDVRVQIDLPILLRMLKSAVESKVNEKLNQLL